MMTTHLFVIANVKQLRTGGSFKILLPFFPELFGVLGVLNSAIFNSFHNRVVFGTILEGLRNFGGAGGRVSTTLVKPMPTRPVLFKRKSSDPSTPCSTLWPNLLHSIKYRMTSKLSIDEKWTL
jgi:hypothetical protein